ncbi:class I SAM-dependent methyltransferase [Natronogracilivirga saccharolytica]|uniref:Methyltransferase domain-containing protein n=1 Tax=Natronogracilivirga saccharolytica TaxID=2812953 RepID=A0A8J7RJ26_9BACT|nr:rRNA adenine N-6-methyltransferase family protein [Natronogracilivirga saccharolytica]MBP3191655.1 methyltransferase domain-containing protein [Natronogracilivirga saccharolytica]
MPSSRYLARDAVKMVVENLRIPGRDPVSVLELGPGTGTFTEHILPHLKKEDSFDAVELNDYFFKILRRKFRVNSRVSLHHKDFLKFTTDNRYDFVVSSLPYERIPKRITRDLWEHKLELCKPDSYIIYYKYVNFNHFRNRFEKQLVKNYTYDEKIVFLNMPPARLITLKIDDPGNGIELMNNSIKGRKKRKRSRPSGSIVNGTGPSK